MTTADGDELAGLIPERVDLYAGIVPQIEAIRIPRWTPCGTIHGLDGDV